MRVAFVYPHSNIPVVPAALGDALGVVNYELARRLARDCDIVVYPRRSPLQPGVNTRDGVTYRRYAVWPDQLLGQLKRLDGVVWRDPRRPFRTSSLYYPMYARRVARDCRARGRDVIHVHAVANFLPIMRHANPAARLVFHAHDHAVNDFDRELMHSWLRHADLILACSGFVAGAIRRRFPELAERCGVLHNGADLERFAPPRDGRLSRSGDDACRLLFVGRIAPEKGVHVLLEAFQGIAARHPRATLDIVGPGDLSPKQFVDPFNEDPLFEGLEKFYQEPASYLAGLKAGVGDEIGDRVRFLGPVPNAELGRYYQQADIFIFPSLWQEPFGMPLVEAMAAGLPVVATESGAFPEIVEHGRTGLLVPRGDARRLAAAVGSLVANPALRRDMGQAGLQRARQQFSWDHSAQRLLTMYHRLLEPDQSDAVFGPT